MNKQKGVGAICTEWWRQSLANDDGPARMTRARLRRCTAPVETLTIEAVHNLNGRLRSAGYPPSADQLALLAVSLAHVSESGTQKLASAFGRRETRDGPRALNSSRFHTLVRTTDRAELIAPLRRAMAIVRRTPIHVPALASDLYHWNEHAQNSWCFQYFGASDADPERIQPENDE